MKNKKSEDLHYDSVGAWAKRLYLASRVLMDSVLRAYDLGSTQWYVLYQLANNGPMMQRDLVSLLKVEKATLSGVIATLVRKGLVDQKLDLGDQRQRMLHLTVSGKKLWKELPDPGAIVLSAAFDGANEADLATTISVLQAATERLDHHILERNSS